MTNETNPTTTRKPHVRAVKAYEITDGAGQHVAFSLARTPAAACELVRPQLQARMLTIVEAAQVPPGDWVTAESVSHDGADGEIAP